MSAVQRSGRAHAILGAVAAALGCVVGGGEVDVCDVVTDDTDCMVCVKTGCCEQYRQCRRDTDCTCILACSDAGRTRAQCASNCSVTQTEIADVLHLLGDQQDCDVQCADQCPVYGFDDG